MPNGRRVEALFWDNDGVLVDTEQLYFEATRDVLASIGIPLSDEDYLELFLKQGKGAWHLAEARGIASADVERLRDERNRLYSRRLAAGPRAIPGVKDVLEALRGKYVMGIVTSSRRDHFDLIHRSTGLLEYFDFVLTADDLRRVKPDPEPYLRAIERSGASSDACVAIEDSERGLESATAAGIGCIIVPTALTRSCSFAGARSIVASAGEILAVL